jgi:hypothetical protein
MLHEQRIRCFWVMRGALPRLAPPAFGGGQRGVECARGWARSPAWPCRTRRSRRGPSSQSLRRPRARRVTRARGGGSGAGPSDGPSRSTAQSVAKWLNRPPATCRRLADVPRLGGRGARWWHGGGLTAQLRIQRRRLERWQKRSRGRSTPPCALAAALYPSLLARGCSDNRHPAPPGRPPPPPPPPVLTGHVLSLLPY